MLEQLKPVGDYVTQITQKILELVPAEYLTRPETAKIISLLVIVGLIYGVLKFVTSLEKVVKITIVGLLILLALSVIATFVS